VLLLPPAVVNFSDAASLHLCALQYGAEGHRALFMYASSFFLVGMGGQSYEIYNRDLLTCPVVYG
jgi:hypothetical protein